MADRNRPDSKIHKMIAGLCGALLVVYMAFAIMPTTVYAQTISGNGYSFDTETGKLHIDNDAGTTAWREDPNIPKEDVLSVEFQRLYSPVLNIGDNAFAGCTNLTGTIKINAKATSIGENAFQGCENLDAVWIPEGAGADVETAGIPDSVAYMVYEYLGDQDYSLVVKDVDYGSKDQILYDGHFYSGTWSMNGVRLLCDETNNIVPVNNMSEAWYYRTETDGTITITKIVDPYSNQTLVLEKQVGDMVISQYTKEAFEDLDPSITVLVDEGITAGVPDRLSKVVVQTEQGKKVAYFTLGTEAEFDEWLLERLRLPIDTSTLYVKDHIVNSADLFLFEAAVVSYHEDAQGNVIVDNVLKDYFDEPYTVSTSIEGKPVTTVLVNGFQNSAEKIVIDPSVNQIIYTQDVDDQDADLIFTSIRQGSGQQAVEIPVNRVGEIGESAFDENVQMIIVPEGSRVNAPADVAQLVYRVDDQGNVIVTDVVAAVDGNGQKQKLDIPDFIAGKAPILSQTVKDKMTQIPHTHIGGTATCAEKAVCTVCGAEYGEPDSANHTNLVKTEAKPATHMTEGNIEYWYCDGCDKYFSNEAGTEEISLEDTVIPKLTEHTADGTGWHSDEISHWNTCECGEKLNEAAHTFEWVIDKEATVTEAGLRHEECTVCGYEKAAVEIPATGITEDPSEPPTDTNKPSSDQTDNTTSPETGDNSNISLWIVVLLAAGAALTGTVLYSRKRKYSK